MATVLTAAPSTLDMMRSSVSELKTTFDRYGEGRFGPVDGRLRNWGSPVVDSPSFFDKRAAKLPAKRRGVARRV